MPFLRVVRDKRGYETTYLIHATRDGGGRDTQVLYAFRSPGGVRVGRSALDPDVRRDIEHQHPTIGFDWNGILSAQQVIDASPVERRGSGRRRPPAAQSETPPPASPRRPDSQPPRLVVPSSIEGDTAEQRMRFLAHWHGILCEQLPQRVPDAQRREALMALVNRLNPAGWLEPDEITAGVQDASEALDRLSNVFARRRRKNRRGARSASSLPASSAEGTPPEEAPEELATGDGSVESPGAADTDDASSL